MKTIVLGDIHGEGVWQRILESEKDYQRAIFVGDYLDTHKKEIPAVMQLDNLKKIVEFKKKNRETIETHLLIGNHDHHYWPGVRGGSTSGYQRFNAQFYTEFFEENKREFKMAFCDEYNRLYTHAGVSKKWLEEVDILDTAPYTVAERINELFFHEPSKFSYHYEDNSGYGDHTLQTPIWIRPTSLVRCMLPTTQIIGHTRQKGRIDPLVSQRTNFWMIDALAFDHHSDYLVIIDDLIKVHTLIHN
jgi:hypothetical protein